ncbi:SOS response-associated peptidase [Enterocloster asparagiformis]|uniref:SOS response-associated peptidase n=1 Tax=Enterocloster asparagiformis TaxID=333367 RepID=UPI002A806149|nr:SOS response-associated peptidase [Enterocloster asparagiformis]
MCSRFCIDQEMWRELKELFGDLDRMFSGWKWNRSGQDIRPTNQSLVITAGEDNRLEPALQRWGLPDSYHKSTIINARAETALEKRMFRDSVASRRLAVPAARFYEWDREKQKVAFYRKGRPALYMAGFYSPGEDGWNFCILTTEANSSVGGVHDRMPLVIEREQVRDWILDGDRTAEFLTGRPPKLDQERDYEQLSLFW